MSTLKEFKEFAIKGNVMDLAIAVIIGGAFGKIVTSLVSDVLMPTIGLIVGQVDFSTLAFTIGESTIAYGKFIQSVVDFVIVAFCIFIAMKQINKLKKPTPVTPAPETPADIKLLTEIRDLLKK